MHIAGLPGLPRCDDAERRLEEANIVATDRLAAAAAAAGARRFIHVSSIRALVGNSAGGVVTDASVPHPDGLYGRSKRAAEARVAELAGAGCLAVSLRPTLVIAPDASGNWRALQRLAATGLPLPFASVKARRSYIAVDTLAAAIAHLCSGDWTAELPGTYWLSDAERPSLVEVLTELRRGMGLPPRLVPFPMAAFRAIGRMTGRQREVASLVGPLEVDGSLLRSLRLRGAAAAACRHPSIRRRIPRRIPPRGSTLTPRGPRAFHGQMEPFRRSDFATGSSRRVKDVPGVRPRPTAKIMAQKRPSLRVS